jgi:CheY-like chemotaxis protein
VPRPFLLLVEDSPDMGLIVASLGKRAGCEVSVCEDAETAWQVLPHRRPDLVLLDVNLPGLSGVDWLRRVRGAPQFVELPVALYTHWGLPSDIVAGLDAGADFLFDKDLASRPTAWQGRLKEILAGTVYSSDDAQAGAWPNERCLPSITGGQPNSPAPATWAVAFNQALRRPSFRRVPREVLSVLLRRALTQVFAARILPQELDAWMAPDGLNPNRLPASLAPDSPLRLAVCAAEQLARVLGDDAGSAFRDALAATFPGVWGHFLRP